MLPAGLELHLGGNRAGVSLPGPDGITVVPIIAGLQVLGVVLLCLGQDHRRYIADSRHDARQFIRPGMGYLACRTRFSYTSPRRAGIAQLVEQRTRNA